MIAVKNVTKTFSKLKALNNLSISFHRGQCVALLGPNGCGKTTLIKTILGMVVPDKGDIEFNGQSIFGQWKYRNQIGYMPQIGRYPENMTIANVFDMMKDIRRDSQKILDETLIRSFNLDAIMQKKMHTLSGGTRQKVSAALAFKEKIIHEKEKGKLILITSHVLSELDDLITDVFYMQEGQVAFHKKLEELKTETGEEKLSKAIPKFMISQ